MKILLINPDNGYYTNWINSLPRVTKVVTNKSYMEDYKEDFAVMEDSYEAFVFCGGTDINPSIYNAEPNNSTQSPDYHRDEQEIYIYNEVRNKGKPIIGICRGAQLLCALNRGSLVQHNTRHSANSHDVYLEYKGKIKTITPAADHHQTMISVGGEILGSAKDGVEEIVLWRKTNSLAVQPHPEWRIVPLLDSLINDFLGGQL